MDRLTWLPSNLAEQLKQVVPKNPSTLPVMELCEQLFGKYWESGDELDMPSVKNKTPWDDPRDYPIYLYYSFLVYHWYE